MTSPETPAAAPTGIYLHIPFCLSKCAYCAFPSTPVAGHDPAAYLKALDREIDSFSEQAWCREREFTSLFIGGGTPTILEAGQLAALVSRVRQKFRLSGDAEITVETNPNTVDAPKLAALKKAGVNRLSIGLQACDDATLQRLDRSHTWSEGKTAVALARRAGFANLSLDLIYGLPGQTPQAWRATLGKAGDLAPEHLSAYQLSLDAGSRFAALAEAGRLELPDEDSVATMAEETVSLLAAAGFERYEISNYAREGFRCRHNLVYWQNRSYLGLGAGAVGCLSGLRLRNTENPRRYVECWNRGEPAWIEGEALDHEASFRETVVMGLRLIDGLDLDDLRRRFSLDPQEYYGDLLTDLQHKGLLEITNDRLRLTATALPIANQVLSELV